ncbi:MAG: hypothetical protein H7238_12440 [Polaromonas sp.]|nr:hypothetical protein [Polaromonas sp.]
MSIDRVSSHLSAGSAGPGNQAQAAKASGTWRGRGLALAPAGTAQAVLLAQQMAGQGLPLVPARDLGTRRASAESSFRSIPTGEIFRRAPTMGINLAAVRSGARAILSGNFKSSGKGSAGSRYLALQCAASCLDDDATDAEVTAWLTDTGGDKTQGEKPRSPQELLEQFRQAVGDSEQFEEFLETVLAGLDITPDDAKDFAEKLRNERHDDQKVLKLLREAQRIPSLHGADKQAERIRLRQKIQEEIREFERSNEGPAVLAHFNAAPVAEGLAEPQTFLQQYAELVSKERSFAETVKLLLRQGPLEALEALLKNMKAALGQDLEAATPSRDTRWLGAVLTHLGNAIVSSSMIDAVKDLVGLIRRRQESGKDRKKKRGQAADSDDEEESKGDDKRILKGAGHVAGR